MRREEESDGGGKLGNGIGDSGGWLGGGDGQPAGRERGD